MNKRFTITMGKMIEATGNFDDGVAIQFESFDDAFDFGRANAEFIRVISEGNADKVYNVSDFNDQLAAAASDMRGWLAEKGIKYFQDLYDACDGIPISIHLREGMQVRNFLRQNRNCAGWHTQVYEFFDYIYTEALCIAIRRTPKRETLSMVKIS